MRTLYAFLIVIVVLCAMPRNADAQLYVLLNNVSQIGTVSEYSPKGELINSNFITGLADPAGIAVSGNNLFVTDNVTDTVGKYDATTGGAINAGFIMGLQSPFAIAVLGNNLFVTYYTGQNHYAVGEYDATTGAAINANLITGLNTTFGLTVLDNKLFVTTITTKNGGGTFSPLVNTTPPVEPPSTLSSLRI